MSSAFVLVPEKWYLERKGGETVGHADNLSNFSTREQRTSILNKPNASKIVSFYDRQVEALRPKPAMQTKVEPDEPDPEDIVSDNLHLTGIRKIRAMQIYRMLIRNRRIAISAHDTIIVDGVDSGIPIVQFLYDSQTLKSNIPSTYLLLFRMLNLSDQNFTVYKPAAKKRKVVTSTPISRRTRSQQPRTLFKEEVQEPSRDETIEKIDTSLKSAKEEWSEDEDEEFEDSTVEIKPEKTVSWKSHP